MTKAAVSPLRRGGLSVVCFRDHSKTGTKIYLEEAKKVAMLMMCKSIASGLSGPRASSTAMAVRANIVGTRLLVVLLLALVSSGVVGCAQIGRFTSSIGRRLSGKPAGFEIVPLGNQDVVVLNADDVIQVMRRAGFSDQQILELGTSLRNALLHAGAAQVKLRDKVEAVFAVHGDYVFITTRLRGSFIYDVNRGWVQLSAVAPKQ